MTPTPEFVALPPNLQQRVSLTPKTLSACRGQRQLTNRTAGVPPGKRAYLRRLGVARFLRGNGADVPAAEGLIGMTSGFLGGSDSRCCKRTMAVE
jgi:hypothetical protein